MMGAKILHAAARVQELGLTAAEEGLGRALRGLAGERRGGGGAGTVRGGTAGDGGGSRGQAGERVLPELGEIGRLVGTGEGVERAGGGEDLGEVVLGRGRGEEPGEQELEDLGGGRDSGGVGEQPVTNHVEFGIQVNQRM